MHDKYEKLDNDLAYAAILRTAVDILEDVEHCSDQLKKSWFDFFRTLTVKVELIARPMDQYYRKKNLNENVKKQADEEGLDALQQVWDVVAYKTMLDEIHGPKTEKLAAQELCKHVDFAKACPCGRVWVFRFHFRITFLGGPLSPETGVAVIHRPGGRPAHGWGVVLVHRLHHLMPGTRQSRQHECFFYHELLHRAQTGFSEWAHRRCITEPVRPLWQKSPPQLSKKVVSVCFAR